MVPASELIIGYLSGVMGVVEASSCEHFYLWKEFHQERGVRWSEVRPGLGCVVGYDHGRPVCISLLVDVISGHRVLFYYATSQIVDYVMIREWLEKNCPKTAFKGDWFNHTDAQNFSNIFGPGQLNYGEAT